MNFCPGCGKELEKDKDFCLDCAPIMPLHSKNVHISVCHFCRRCFYGNKWVKTSSLENAVKNVVKNNIKERKRIEIHPNLPDIEYRKDNKIKFDIEVVRGEDLFKIPGEINIDICDFCKKRAGDYFEGILQLRNTDKEIFDYIDGFLNKHKIYVSKKQKVGKDFDLYVSDKRKIQNLGHNLVKTFGGELKINPKLHTRDNQKSKDVFRVNVFYKGPDYKKNDVVVVKDKIIKIKKMGKILSGIDIKTDKRVSIPIKNNEIKRIKKRKTRISKVNPQLEVLDPETFDSVVVETSLKKFTVNEKVKVVQHKGRTYIV